MCDRVARWGMMLLLAATVTGCGYRWTYDDAFPHVPLQVERWDPPDSIAFTLVEPPRVEAVILDAYLYYLIHPPGEAEAREREELARRRGRNPVKPTPPVTAPDTVTVAALEPSPVDSVMARAEPTPPPVQVDLSPSQEEALLRATQVDLAVAESLLRVVEPRAETKPALKEQIRTVRAFLAQTRDAVAQRDFQGAANLALKARSLAEELLETVP